ncbi:MAG: aldehyde dehydrogenase family protein [Lacipirellulaceae bacterium]
MNDSIAAIVAAARDAQPAWEAAGLRARLRVIDGVRRAIGSDPDAWAETITAADGERTRAVSLATEVGPVADACRWLGRRAAGVLAPRRSGGLLAALVGGVSIGVRRKPHGVVLVVGASNYPLLLLAIPALQALAAGNAVLLKPPPGGEAAAERLHEALERAGLDAGLCAVLGNDAAAAQQAIAAGVDHIVATGSSTTGRAVAAAAAQRLTPCTLECSGSDAVVVLAGADTRRVIDCVAWGLLLNGGATCIAPRRLIVVDELYDDVTEGVIERLLDVPPVHVPAAVAEGVRRVVGAELDAGSTVYVPARFTRADLDRLCDERELGPIVLAPRSAPSAVSQADTFAPVLSLEVAADVDHAVELANDSPYALGASVFGRWRDARGVANRLRAGCVTVNDLIAPTADPRVPFGGAAESGYGVTRGAEGLLAMTRPQATVRRRGRWLPHLDAPRPTLDDLVAGMIQMKHARGFTARCGGLRRLIAAAKRQPNQTNNET